MEEKFPYLLGYTTWYVLFWFIYFPSSSSSFSFYSCASSREGVIKTQDFAKQGFNCRQMPVYAVCNVGTVSKAAFGETSERQGGVHVGFSKCRDTIFN